MIIFLAALLDVPKHLYESARLDGAGAWQRLRQVTLPTISPVILFAVVIGVIEALAVLHRRPTWRAPSPPRGPRGQAGDVTNELGYPQDSTLFYPVLLYQQGFRYFNMGYAVGDGGDAAVRRARRDPGDPAALAAAGSTTRGGLR